jgi:hypothetical protein
MPSVKRTAASRRLGGRYTKQYPKFFPVKPIQHRSFFRYCFCILTLEN